MQRIKIFINQINPAYLICGYFLLLISLTLFKIQPYNFHLSSLVGVWKGFVELNPNLIDHDFIVYADGGYDGQFFYMIAKSLYTNGFQNFPILDSFYLRFNRIGLPILSGFIANLFGFRFYPIITLSLLISLHIYSFLLLRAMLDQKNKHLAYFYLFSPFSLNSILLLVSDSLFVSFSIICIYLLKQLGNDLFKSSLNRAKSRHIYPIAFIIFSFTCFIRESGLVLLGTFFLLSIFDKNFRVSILAFSAVVLYLIITCLFKLIPNVHPGINPLSFIDLMEYPFIGFYKSIQFNTLTDIKSIFREFAKFPIFIFYVLLILNLKNIKKVRFLILFLPIIFILFTVGVGDVGYWLSFDNISRMFTFSIVWIILFKNYNQAYNDYYALSVSFFVLILLIIRLVYIKSPMKYYIY